jgi:hypothetical protein
MHAIIITIVVGIALATVGHASAQSGTKHQVRGPMASEDCFQGECFKEYLISMRKNPSGLITAQSRVEFYCEPGSNCDPNRHPETHISNVLCKTPGGYIETVSPAHNERIPEPEANPPHATKSDKQLWTSVCSAMAGH